MKHMTNPMTRPRYNTLRRLAYIPVPTLVVWGDKDATNDVSMAHELHDGIKGSKLVIFEGIGHGPSKPKSHRATMEHNLEWFDQYLFQAGTKPSTENR